jgi:ferrochelatase
MERGSFGCNGRRDKIGILLAQLGTPEAPTKEALRPYLKQFLSDRRVIEVNPVLWWLVLNLIILRVRPAKSAALYARVWEEGGSPLLIYTRAQAEQLQERLQRDCPDVEVDFGMRYGAPSLEDGIDRLLAKGCTKLLLFPMYPQYSGATTGSTYDAVMPHLLKQRFVPTLRVVEPYYAHPQYIRAQAQVINDALAAMDEPPEKLLLSYHGVPAAYVQKGDPYCCHCTETTQALIDAIDLPRERIIQTYQSRFGNDPWLEPYTDETVEALAKQGVKRIAISCPGFTADCLETLDEMGNEAWELFEEHGGEHLELIPCLNDAPVWLDAMEGMAREELGSWLTTSQRNRAKRCAVTCPAEQLDKLLWDACGQPKGE